MKIEVFETPFPYIRIYDFYTDGELELIWKELDFILNDNILKGPEKTGTAKSNGVVLKNPQNLDEFKKLIDAELKK